MLFVVYLVVFCLILGKISFVRNARINSKLLIGLFLLKILAGIVIGWISLNIYGEGNDYWEINKEAWKEYQLLFTEPAKYFTNIFTSDYPGGYTGLFSSFNSYWNDLKGNILIKIISVFNFFSRGDYYINSLFFNFFIFFGHITLFRLFKKLYPGREKLLIIGCFLLPSTLYFSSGIHKDGVVFLMLAILIYSVYQSLSKNKIDFKRGFLILVCLLFLLLIRSYIFLALMPAIFAWVVSVKFKWPPRWTFTSVYILAGLLFFNINSIISAVNPLEIIINKQAEYLNLPVASTQIDISPLQPNFKSFVSNLPQALNHSLLRPYLWELQVKSVLPLSLELFIYQLLFVLLLFFGKKDFDSNNKAFLFFAICFTLTGFLLIGYIVPNLGSLVRYRSLYLPLIITPLLCYLDWSKLKGLVGIIKKYM